MNQEAGEHGGAQKKQNVNGVSGPPGSGVQHAAKAIDRAAIGAAFAAPSGQSTFGFHEGQRQQLLASAKGATLSSAIDDEYLLQAYDVSKGIKAAAAREQKLSNDAVGDTDSNIKSDTVGGKAVFGSTFLQMCDPKFVQQTLHASGASASSASQSVGLSPSIALDPVLFPLHLENCAKAAVAAATGKPKDPKTTPKQFMADICTALGKRPTLFQ